MRPFKFVFQFIFYALILALLVSRSVSAVISHDENQFISTGQFLADHGLLPYVDYPYTHMPYAVAIYAVTASVTSYDYLAGRLLTSVVWLLCFLVIVSLTRIVRDRPASPFAEPPPVPELLWEFALVLALLYHPVAAYVLSPALNHSFATFFSLLALLFFVRASRLDTFSYRDPLHSGIAVSLAAWTRFNYASLLLILFVVWLLHSLVFRASRPVKTVSRYILGVLVAAVPVLALLIAAPAHFYYGNLVYIRLNTIYYEGLLYRSGMDLIPKFRGFLLGVSQRPIDWLLYGALVVLSVLSLIRVIRRPSLLDLGLFATAGFSFVLWLTAYAPTPALTQYFFAPLPFMLVLFAWGMLELRRFVPRTYLVSLPVLLLAIYTSTHLQNPISELARLSQPSSWTPIEVHDFSVSLRQYVPPGAVLSLLPMVPLEAGYDAYPFAATGPFSWRTSLLLTAPRRAQYGVTSPNELPAVLAAAPPAAILTGFEAPNAGFQRQDLGGLETPLMDYAVQHDYRRIQLAPRFLEHPLILWVRPQ
jgi:hypothetical protein